MSNNRIVALVPAYNEASSIAATIESLLAQTRPADEIVIIPNGCTDDTAEIARQYPVTVMELPRLEHRKSEALNRAWLGYAVQAEMVVGIDADTILVPTAIEDWLQELEEHPNLAGSASKFTMHAEGLLQRLQKFEYGQSIDNALRRGWTNILPGAGCAYRGSVLREVASRNDRTGPWSYESATEDYELTYRVRELGYSCHVSPTVRSYTDPMKDLKSIWNQRLKWTSGGIEDLLRFGVNRLTWRDWAKQAFTWLGLTIKVLWITLITLGLVFGIFQIAWYWALPPLLYTAIAVKQAYRIPHRDWKDILLAASFLPNELYAWMESAWVLRSWWDVLASKITKKKTDHWAAQYAAEGV